MPLERRLWMLMLCALMVPRGITAAEIMVCAAASLTDVMEEAGAAYEKQAGNRPAFNFGASSLLARQIQEGAPCDLFVSADEAKMDQLQAKGLIETTTRVKLLSNSLVVVTPQSARQPMREPKDLLSLKRIALAEPETVPAGIYAREYLTSMGLWEKLRERVVPAQNVRAALAAVASGNVDAAIVYKTDAAISKDVRVAFEVRGPSAPAISYPAAVLRDASHPEAARDFLRYLRTPAGRQIFTKFGFINGSP